MQCSEQDVPDEDTDKLLFAEDLMKFVMSLNGWRNYKSERAERFRQQVHNGYTPDTDLAITWMLRKGHESIDYEYRLLSENFTSAESLRVYAGILTHQCLRERFDADIFLKFCVRVSGLAVHYYNSGVLEATDIAINAISDALKLSFPADGWQKLAQTVKNYADFCETTSSSSDDGGSNED